MDHTLNDAFLNVGLPQFTNREEFSKSDIKTMISTIKEFDSYYLDGWKQSETRNTLKEFINNYCVFCRWYSLIIK